MSSLQNGINFLLDTQPFSKPCTEQESGRKGLKINIAVIQWNRFWSGLVRGRTNLFESMVFQICCDLHKSSMNLSEAGMHLCCCESWESVFSALLWADLNLSDCGGIHVNFFLWIPRKLWIMLSPLLWILGNPEIYSESSRSSGDNLKPHCCGIFVALSRTFL